MFQGLKSRHLDSGCLPGSIETTGLALLLLGEHILDSGCLPGSIETLKMPDLILQTVLTPWIPGAYPARLKPSALVYTEPMHFRLDSGCLPGSIETKTGLSELTTSCLPWIPGAYPARLKPLLHWSTVFLSCILGFRVLTRLDFCPSPDHSVTPPPPPHLCAVMSLTFMQFLPKTQHYHLAWTSPRNLDFSLNCPHILKTVFCRVLIAACLISGCL